MRIKFLDNLANDLGFLESKELTPTSNDEVVIPEGYKIEKTPDGGFKITPEEKLDEGQSIIDLVEEKGTSKEGSKEESKEKSDKDDSKDTKADKADSKADKAEEKTEKPESKPEGKDGSDDNPEEYFREESEKEAIKSEPAKVAEKQKISQVVVDSTAIEGQKGDDKKMAHNGSNIADLMIRFDHQKLTASVAEFIATDGKVMDARLTEIVQSAIQKNPDTRKFISGIIPELIHEFPDEIKQYQKAVFDVARNVRVKYMLRIPETGTLYESMDTFFDQMARENPTLAIEYGRGIRKPQEVWLRTDCDGKIISQDHTLSEAEVRKLILDLPKEIQDEACEKLHLPRMVVKPSKGNKPDDKSGKSGKPGNKPGKPDNHA